MWIKYFIPEDGDEESCPNIFNSKIVVQSITLKHIKQAFPVPGSFHFRFLKALEMNLNVWLDVVDDEVQVPMFEGAIFMKVTRIVTSLSSTASSSPRNLISKPPTPTNTATANNTHGDITRNGVPSTKQPATATVKPPKAPPSAEKLLQFDAFDDHQMPPPPTATASSTTTAATATSSSSSATTTTATTIMSTANLLAFSDDSGDLFSSSSSTAASSSFNSFQAQKASSSASDLFGLETLQPVAMSAPIMQSSANTSPFHNLNTMGGPVGNMGTGMGRGNMGMNMNMNMGARGGGGGVPQNNMNAMNGSLAGPGGFDAFGNFSKAESRTGLIGQQQQQSQQQAQRGGIGGSGMNLNQQQQQQSIRRPF